MPIQTIFEYKTLSNSSSDGLDREVNDYLQRKVREGDYIETMWTVHGSQHATISTSSTKNFYQPMVRVFHRHIEYHEAAKAKSEGLDPIMSFINS